MICLGTTELIQPVIWVGHSFLASEQLREVDIELGSCFVGTRRAHTALVLTLAAQDVTTDGFDPAMVVTPADQTATNTVALTQSMHAKVREAAGGGIVNLSITPDLPETGYVLSPTVCWCNLWPATEG
jgi:mannose-1-phosphate guanylyltransferase/mannose-6-phosphate isomerase